MTGKIELNITCNSKAGQAHSDWWGKVHQTLAVLKVDMCEPTQTCDWLVDSLETAIIKNEALNGKLRILREARKLVQANQTNTQNTLLIETWSILKNSFSVFISIDYLDSMSLFKTLTRDSWIEIEKTK